MVSVNEPVPSDTDTHPPLTGNEPPKAYEFDAPDVLIAKAEPPEDDVLFITTVLE
jgi:hypothetical protein